MLYSPTHFSITVSMSVRNSLQPDEAVSVGTWIFLVVDDLWSINGRKTQIDSKPPRSLPLPLKVPSMHPEYP
ncbi:hypothetical protein BFJ63_vAg1828 [Fusarium oxysporum f. sp. narcissi]|uniref:Uncharacterized protein n=1 Tax=Fusarium oxysporum f. sp. narcissi TaxID=451672 RepID=A0A4Q2W6Q8_FUSOX|nr:hypothetical protein BFJ63_vAg1828 [Fusarium oxysporum f. sp. narcissi]